MTKPKLSKQQKEALDELYLEQFYTKEVQEILDISRMVVERTASKLGMKNWHTGGPKARLATIVNLYQIQLAHEVRKKVPGAALPELAQAAEVVAVAAFVKPEYRTQPIVIVGYEGIDGRFVWALEIAGKMPDSLPPPTGGPMIVVRAGALLGKLLARVAEHLTDPERVPPPGRIPPPGDFATSASEELAAAGAALRRAEEAAMQRAA